MLNALSVDVEECFHATEIGADRRDWLTLPSRVEEQTKFVLDLLGQHEIRATFFVLGWVAHYHPAIVRHIVGAGHEIGCHSYAHRLVYDLTPAQFRQDTAQAVKAIADAGGVIPRIYRAPSYSITSRSLWALEILIENGFNCDSSIYPIEHDRYGLPEFGRAARLVPTPSGSIMEVPVATAVVSGQVLPVGGGGYLRLLPYIYTAAGIRRLNHVDRTPACIYFHPWELDRGQPRLRCGRISRWRTYTGLAGMRAKVERLLVDFSFGRLGDIYSNTCTLPQSDTNQAIIT